MKFTYVSIFISLNLALVATHAALPLELYWKSKLPTTQMPKAIIDLLHPGTTNGKTNEKSETLDDPNRFFMVYGKDDASQTQLHDDPNRFFMVYGKDDASQKQLHDDPNRFFMVYGKDDASEKQLHDDPNRFFMVYGKDDASQKQLHDDPNRFFMVYGKDDASQKQLHDDPNRFFMVYGKDAASETQFLHDNPIVALFFLEKDLHLGTKLNMQFKKTSNYGATFLPREVANSIPFSSNKVEKTLNHFSIKQGSKESEIVKNTISECEENDIKGEEKSCVTSLESMVDFTSSILGNNVEAVSTEVNRESDKQQYIIAKGVKKLGENKIVACHKLNYPYAVFYCHKIDSTKVYSVPLEGADGSKVKAIAVCHTDTSQWNPKHFAFQLFKVQPGTVPVCHFVPQDHVIWVSKI